MTKSLVSPSFLKQRARQLKREKSLSQNQALNEAARELGYSNYKNYLNILETNQRQIMSPIELLLKDISTNDDITTKVDLAAAFIKNNLIPFNDLVYILKSFQHLETLKSVCEKANLKADIQTVVLNDFLTEDGKNEIAKFYKKFRAKEVFLGKVNYEMNEDVIYIDGLYELKAEHDSDTSKRKLKDRLLFGTFKMTIDREDIAMEYSVDHNFENMCHVGSKNYFESLQ